MSLKTRRNPSENASQHDILERVAGEPGFEPGLTESESVGLPLTYSPTLSRPEKPVGGAAYNQYAARMQTLSDAFFGDCGAPFVDWDSAGSQQLRCPAGLKKGFAFGRPLWYSCPNDIL